MLTIKDKKGSIGWVAVVIVILLAGTIGLVLYNLANGMDLGVVKFGQRQREIIEAYSGAEVMRDYLTYSGKYAAHQSLYELGTYGGHTNQKCDPEDTECVEPPCGYTIDGYTFWQKGGQICSPLESLTNNFEYLVGKNFNQFLDQYIVEINEEEKEIETLLDNTQVDLSVSSNGYIWITGTPVVETVLIDAVDESGKTVTEEKTIESGIYIENKKIEDLPLGAAEISWIYSVTPYFKVVIPFSLKKYEEVYTAAQSCGKNPSCYTQKTSEVEIWSARQDGDIVKVDVSLNPQIIAFNGEKVVYTKVPIRFAVG